MYIRSGGLFMRPIMLLAVLTCVISCATPQPKSDTIENTRKFAVGDCAQLKDYATGKTDPRDVVKIEGITDRYAYRWHFPTGWDTSMPTDDYRISNFITFEKI